MLDSGREIMSTADIRDTLHRSVKLAMDSGEAGTHAEAQQIFEGYRLAIEVGPDICSSPTKQVALLTAVNVARRCFLGGIEVAGCTDGSLLVPWHGCRTIAEAVVDLQGTCVNVCASESPRIVIGDSNGSMERGDFAVRATSDGWCGGVIPLEDNNRLPERQEFTPAGVLAGSLAVSEAFQFVRGRNVQAGRRSIGLSLWRPGAENSWLEGHEPGPALEVLPSKAWLIGLGHLGQAYLWTLGFLPYEAPQEVFLVLQDYDSLVPANDSTSILTRQAFLGQKKTRAVASWCERRGFQTRIQERRFAANFKVDDEEPHVALCGVDNGEARAALEDVGFTQVIEAGLGYGTEEFLAFQMHSFPAVLSACDRWGGQVITQHIERIIEKSAYEALAAEGLEDCGLTMLAGSSVGAAFVGAMVSSLVVAELLRMTIGGHRYEVIDGDLRGLAHRRAVISECVSPPFNPGLTAATRS